MKISSVIVPKHSFMNSTRLSGSSASDAVVKSRRSEKSTVRSSSRRAGAGATDPRYQARHAWLEVEVEGAADAVLLANLGHVVKDADRKERGEDRERLIDDAERIPWWRYRNWDLLM